MTKWSSNDEARYSPGDPRMGHPLYVQVGDDYSVRVFVKNCREGQGPEYTGPDYEVVAKVQSLPGCEKQTICEKYGPVSEKTAEDSDDGHALREALEELFRRMRECPVYGDSIRELVDRLCI